MHHAAMYVRGLINSRKAPFLLLFLNLFFLRSSLDAALACGIRRGF